MRDEGAVASLSSQDGLDTTAGHVVDISPDSGPGHPFRNFLPSSGLVSGILRELGITPADAAAARLAARINDSDLARELLVVGKVGEEDLARAIATALGLPMEPIRAGDRIADDAARPPDWHLACPKVLRTCDAALQAKLFVAPALEEVVALHRVLARYPERRSLVRVTTARAIARHRALASAAARSAAADLSLAGPSPDHSARRVMTGSQGFVAAGLIALLATLAWNLASGLLLLLHLLALSLFLVGGFWRLSAAMSLHRKRFEPNPSPLPPMPHPVYTVLVALHREAEMVPGLVAGLAELRWPRSKLEVMLVCEADDPQTIAAARAAIADLPCFEIVEVTPSHPRTKPKALNVALPLATGEYVVLYDAEDHPHPEQLEAAWLAFRRAGPTLACLQAPLVVRNGERTWLSGHFALEYAALFRGLLPWLAYHGLPIPLGGTSNHFRRAALIHVGAWDSHNVTEDADLGVRLARHGYAIGTIDEPTGEEGPELWPVWLRQRTRWMKGWLQTWLVHMRNPVQLWRELGPKRFGALQVLFFGMIGSALAHPLSILLLFYTAVAPHADASFNRWLIVIDLAAFALGYLAYGVLLLSSLTKDECRQFRPLFLSVYLYWLLISVAVMRAMAQLVRDPHRWEKTPHGSDAMARRPRKSS